MSEKYFMGQIGSEWVMSERSKTYPDAGNKITEQEAITLLNALAAEIERLKLEARIKQQRLDETMSCLSVALHCGKERGCETCIADLERYDAADWDAQKLIEAEIPALGEEQ